MKKKLLVFGFLFSMLLPSLYADEGMWLPLLLKKKEADMQKNGMRITAEDIYSVNRSSLKDAVMLFGGGCTGEFVSREGLVLTNHHCGYSYIVSHSTVERDYLTNGFWAANKSEELPCKGLSVTLLVYMEDVTEKVLEGVNNDMAEKDRAALIEKNIENIKKKATENNHYQADIKPFYYGNQYFMYVNEVFTDVRLVGAPPSNIGKFGGDTDNWMWPRHTGDFSVFRVYADKDGKPRDYSKDNVPYKPKKYLSINISGTEEGDFTFVFGYPGTTRQFLTSQAVDFVQNVEDPTRIKLRTECLNVYNEAMQKSPAQRLRYASTVASIANGWKKWQGELKGLKRMNAIEKKKAFERDFNKWANLTEENRERYGGLLADFDKYYSQSIEAKKSYIYMNEALLASDAMLYALRLLTLADISTDESVPEEKVKENAENTYGYLMEYFSQDYENHKEVDRDIFVRTMTIFYNDFAKDRYVWLRKNVESGKYNNAEAYFTDVYNSSLLSNPKKAEKLLKKYKRKKAEELMEDPMVEILGAVLSKFRKVDMVELNGINEKLDSLYRVYVEGIMKMDTVKEFYPDANLTLRVAYGNVKSYKPRDGVEYMPYTTIEGIMEKENPQIYDYVVEERLKQLYNAKDYGVYANEKGELPVAFIASNHTTGGNSGSPVLDADGNLIGINFDRNWEGTMSDIMYDPDQCRNISLDIRYCLFIIDKFAGAKHLIDEMTIVK